MDKSNATFDSTLNSTLDTNELGGNSTKIGESTIENDVDEADVESDTKDETTEMVQDVESPPETTTVSLVHFDFF